MSHENDIFGKIVKGTMAASVTWYILSGGAPSISANTLRETRTPEPPPAANALTRSNPDTNPKTPLDFAAQLGDLALEAYIDEFAPALPEPAYFGLTRNSDRSITQTIEVLSGQANMRVREYCYDQNHKLISQSTSGKLEEGSNPFVKHCKATPPGQKATWIYVIVDETGNMASRDSHIGHAFMPLETPTLAPTPIPRHEQQSVGVQNRAVYERRQAYQIQQPRNPTSRRT